MAHHRRTRRAPRPAHRRGVRRAGACRLAGDGVHARVPGVLHVPEPVCWRESQQTDPCPTGRRAYGDVGTVCACRRPSPRVRSVVVGGLRSPHTPHRRPLPLVHSAHTASRSAVHQLHLPRTQLTPTLMLQATYIPVMVLEFLSAQYIAEKVPAWLPWQTAFGPTPSALPFATFVFFNAWVWQFVGHFKFEGRAPALFDNLTQGEYSGKGGMWSLRTAIGQGEAGRQLDPDLAATALECQSGLSLRACQAYPTPTTDHTTASEAVAAQLILRSARHRAALRPHRGPLRRLQL